MREHKFLYLVIAILGLFGAMLNAAEITIGSGNQQARVPMDFYWRNSLFETLFFPDELDFDSGSISEIKFYNSFTTHQPSGHTRIWLGSTQQNDLISGYIPSSSLVMVYDGVVNYPSGNNTITIPLDTPYIHFQGNLVMMVQRPWDESWYNLNDTFKAQSIGSNRSRNVYSSSDAFDPQYPPLGTLSGVFPQTTFVYTHIQIINDLGINSLSGNSTPRVGQSEAYTVNIHNNGSLEQTNYQLKLFDTSGSELASVAGMPVAAGESLDLQIHWTPNAAGSLGIYAQLFLTGDEIAYNDKSPVLNLVVQTANTHSVSVGEGNQNLRLPLDFFYKNSIYQGLYYPDEIGAFGKVSSLTLYNNFTSRLTQKPIKIWLGSTALNDLSAGWVSAGELTEVFDGFVNFPAGENEITISLDTPFDYTEGNLLMMFQRSLDTVYYTNTDFFKAQTIGTNRARNAYSDTVIYDPLNPGNVGNLSGQHPKLTFHFAPLTAEPYFSLSPNDGSFGNVLLDSTQLRDYTLTNAGGGALGIQSFSLQGSEYFSLQGVPALPITLQNWDLLNFSVQYNPLAEGYHTANLVITDDRGMRETVILQLSGTALDTNIHNLPYHQNFDAVAVPNLPLDWSSLIQPASATAFVGTYASAPYSAPNSVRIYNGSTAGVDVILIAPPLSPQISVNSTQLRMMVKGVATNYTLKIGVMTDPGDASSFTEVQTVNPTAAWGEVLIPFASYLGEGRFIAIKHGFGALGQSIYVDDVTIELDANYDLACMALTGNTNPSVGLPAQYSATVYNWGTQAETDYNVKLYSAAGEELVTVAGVAVPPESAVQIPIQWIPATAGAQSIYAKVHFDLDQNPANDQSPSLSLNVHPETSVFFTIGSGDQNARLPIDFNWKNSLNESLYMEEEFDSFGWISQISFYNQFSSANVLQKPIKIWLGSTTQRNLVPGWISASELTLVFDGVLSFPAGQNQIDIVLDTPFLYNHGNLVMMVNRPMDTVRYSTTDYFKSQTIGSNRARHANSDNIQFNPQNPQEAGTLTGQFAKTSFIIQSQGLAILEGNISSDGQPVAGASISIQNSPFVQISDAAGFYRFPYLQPGNYNLLVSCEGYESDSQMVTLVANQSSVVNFNLLPSQTVNIYGSVVASDAPQVGLPGATISLRGVAQYSAQTNAQGLFQISGVETGNIYQYTVFASGFDTIYGNITVENADIDLGQFVLQEMVLAPRQLRAVPDVQGTVANLTWLAPAAGNSGSLVDEFEYENGGWQATANWGDFNGDWEWTDSYSADDFVDTYGSPVVMPPHAAHSGTGLWGTRINTNYTNANGFSYLGKSFNFSNIPNPELRFWSWENVFGEFDYCRVSVNGQVVWGPSWQYVDTQWNERVINLSQFGGSSFVDIKFEFFATASVAYAGWYLDDVYVGAALDSRVATDLPLLQLDSEVDADGQLRTVHGYQLYRLAPGYENSQSLWTLLTPDLINTLEYTDTEWADLPDGQYKWAVKAKYSANQSSAPAFSNTLRILRNDMSALSVSGPITPSAGQVANYTIQVKNMGSVPLLGSSYTVQLMRGNTELGWAAGVDIASESTANIVIPWQPGEIGEYVLVGRVNLENDSNLNNNNTPPLAVRVLPSSLVGISVGDGSQEARIPIDVYYRSSLNQYLIFPSELGNTSGTITGLSLNYHFSENVSDKTLKLWLGNTTQNNLLAGWHPSGELSLVYDGVVSFVMGQNTLNIEFDTPFEYQAGENLLLSFFHPWQIGSHANTNLFKAQQSHMPNRSRNFAVNSNDLDPANPPVSSGVVSGQFPQTTIYIIPDALGKLSGVVRSSTNQPLEGVEIRVENTTYLTYSDENGYYEIADMMPGSYTAVFSFFSYQTETEQIQITAYEDSIVDINMQPMPVVNVFGSIIASDTQLPLMGVNISLSGYADYTGVTNSSGVFHIPGVFADFSYDYSILYAGYAAVTNVIHVVNQDYDMGTITLYELTYPPHSVNAIMNAEDTQAELSWYPPDPTVLEIHESFESPAFPPLNWSRQVTNTGAANSLGMYPTWCRFGSVNMYGNPIDPQDGSYQAGLRWDYSHQDEWLFSPSFYCPPGAFLQFSSYVYQGSENNEHYYVKISSDNGESWHILWDAGTLSGGWNAYQSPILIDLSNYGGLQVKLAFQALDAPSQDGLWYDWFIDDVLISTPQESIRSLPLYSNSAKADKNGQRVLIGYKVWRFTEGQEENENNWELITPEAVPETELIDTGWQNLPNGIYRWAVKAAYSNNILSAAAFSNSLQRVVETGTVAGLVRGMNNIPIPGATITVAGRMAVTNAAGAYGLVVPEGTHNVLCEAEGYGSQTVENVVVYRNQTSTVNFYLSVDNADESSPVMKTELLANYPNPFNPETTLHYTLKDAANVELAVYNTRGQRVRSLVSQNQSPGRYRLIWDGKDDQGSKVSSGIYFYRLHAGRQQFTRKMILMQ